MKVDCYRSRSRPAHALIVFASTDLSTLDEQGQQVIELLAPIVLEHHDVDLGMIILKEEKDKLIAELERVGYGMMMFSPEVYEAALREEESTRRKLDQSAID